MKDSLPVSLTGIRTYQSQTYILQANFNDPKTEWKIVCAAEEGNNFCQLLGFSAVPYTTGGYGNYYQYK